MKKKLIIILMLMILMLSLAGCKKSNLAVMSDEKSVTIIAENASKDMFGGASAFDVTEGQKLYVDPTLKNGELSIKISGFDPGVDASVEELKDAVSGKDPDMEIRVSGSDPLEYELDPGSYSVYVSVLSKADGTVIMSVR